MGEVVYLERETVGEASLVPRSMRQPGTLNPVSQAERLGQVVERVLEGLTISGDDHRNVTTLCVSCGEVD